MVGSYISANIRYVDGRGLGTIVSINTVGPILAETAPDKPTGLSAVAGNAQVILS